MEICIKENRTKKQTKPIKKQVKEEKPNWYNKKIEEDLATDEDIKALEKRLNSR